MHRAGRTRWHRLLPRPPARLHILGKGGTGGLKQVSTTANLPPASASGKWLIAGILGAGGVAILTLGICLLVPAFQSASWPTTPGVIVGHRITSVHQKQGLRFQVGVSYSFRVNQTSHVGSDFSHSSSSLPITYPSREAAADAYAGEPSFRDWQVGRAVTVSYDPDAPGVAVLQASSTGLAWGVVFLGGSLLAIAGLQWRKYFRQRTATSGGESSVPKG